MPSFRHPPQSPSPARGTASPVLAVGRRVYVSCTGGGPARATLTDEAGTTPLATLADGTEVDVLAWRPRGHNGTRYRVRCARDAIEGWLPAGNLRGSRTPASPPPGPREATPTSPRTVEPGDSGRRFGQSRR